MRDIASFATDTVAALDKLKDVKIERANLGPCPICGRDVIENRKGYSCWTKDDPGCGFVIWKRKAGKNLPPQVVKELMASLKTSVDRGEDSPTGQTEKPVPGFKGRSGRTFRAKLKISRDDGGKWRVDFNEEWAKEPPPEAQAAAADGGAGDGGAGGGAAAAGGEGGAGPPPANTGPPAEHPAASR